MLILNVAVGGNFPNNIAKNLEGEQTTNDKTVDGIGAG